MPRPDEARDQVGTHVPGGSNDDNAAHARSLVTAVVAGPLGCGPHLRLLGSPEYVLRGPMIGLGRLGLVSNADHRRLRLRQRMCGTVSAFLSGFERPRTGFSAAARVGL